MRGACRRPGIELKGLDASWQPLGTGAGLTITPPSTYAYAEKPGPWVRSKTNCVYTLNALACDTEITCFADTYDNAVAALFKRVFKSKDSEGVWRMPHRPSKEMWVLKVSTFTRAFNRCVTPFSPVSHADFCGFYTGRKRGVYERALANINAGWQLNACLSTFIKHEKIIVNPDKELVPRVIQPRKPEYNVLVGRYIRPLEHHIYHIIDEVCGEGTVLKGRNAFQQGSIIAEKWAGLSDPVAVGLDASRFDQHVSAAALEWEHSMYSRFFRGEEREELRKLLSKQVLNKGYARFPGVVMRYSTVGTRCSGDMNTALGNCLIMCALLHTYLTERRIPIRFINCGDDSCVFMERRDLPRFQDGLQAWFLGAGFKIVAEAPVYTLEKVVFCQTQPVWDGTDWRMVRDPHISCSKDATVTHADDFNASHFKQVGHCGMALTSGLPVLQAYYMKLGDAEVTSERIRESGFYRLSKGLEAKARPITVAARVSFALAFDIMPDHQLILEDQLAKTKVDYQFAEFAPGLRLR